MAELKILKAEAVLELEDNFIKYYTDSDELEGADVKIMDRFFRHREVPDSENFSKPGF
ncbi:hypothetical protein [Weissella confusa]|uniref:hypothetical protein n=1 Tax=Weissella confusa TaxID=1583 RepID=UPI00223B159C|nr:hypothetical protein [Weissella confusa]